MKKAKDVNEYIANAPDEFQQKLSRLREIIKIVAPEAQERISYGMPFFDYKGRLAYFALMKNHIGLYIPPPIVEQHAKDLKNYVTTKSSVHLSLDADLPVTLIRKLVRARMKWNTAHSPIK